jgi:hypothetical protein
VVRTTELELQQVQLARPLVPLDLQLVLQEFQPELLLELLLRGSFHQHENEVLLHRQPRLNLQPELRHHQCWMWSQQAHIPM